MVLMTPVSKTYQPTSLQVPLCFRESQRPLHLEYSQGNLKINIPGPLDNEVVGKITQKMQQLLPSIALLDPRFDQLIGITEKRKDALLKVKAMIDDLKLRPEFSVLEKKKSRLDLVKETTTKVYSIGVKALPVLIGTAMLGLMVYSLFQGKINTPIDLDSSVSELDPIVATIPQNITSDPLMTYKGSNLVKDLFAVVAAAWVIIAVTPCFSLWSKKAPQRQPQEAQNPIDYNHYDHDHGHPIGDDEREPEPINIPPNPPEPPPQQNAPARPPRTFERIRKQVDPANILGDLNQRTLRPRGLL